MDDHCDDHHYDLPPASCSSSAGQLLSLLPFGLLLSPARRPIIHLSITVVQVCHASPVVCAERNHAAPIVSHAKPEGSTLHCVSIQRQQLVKLSPTAPREFATKSGGKSWTTNRQQNPILCTRASGWLKKGTSRACNVLANNCNQNGPHLCDTPWRLRLARQGPLGEFRIGRAALWLEHERACQCTDGPSGWPLGVLLARSLWRLSQAAFMAALPAATRQLEAARVARTCRHE